MPYMYVDAQVYLYEAGCSGDLSVEMLLPLLLLDLQGEA